MTKIPKRWLDVMEVLAAGTFSRSSLPVTKDVLNRMKNAGLIESPIRGTYLLSDAGRKVLARNDITLNHLDSIAQQMSDTKGGEDDGTNERIQSVGSGCGAGPEDSGAGEGTEEGEGRPQAPQGEGREEGEVGAEAGSQTRP